jgi:hypothetical protein
VYFQKKGTAVIFLVHFLNYTKRFATINYKKWQKTVEEQKVEEEDESAKAMDVDAEATTNLKVFCGMVQPNVKVRCIDIFCMMDIVDMKSLTHMIMMDASKTSETIPNLDAKFSYFPYKFCDDGPTSDRA